MYTCWILKKPEFLLKNHRLAEELGIDNNFIESKECLSIFLWDESTEKLNTNSTSLFRSPIWTF